MTVHTTADATTIVNRATTLGRTPDTVAARLSGSTRAMLLAVTTGALHRSEDHALVWVDESGDERDVTDDELTSLDNLRHYGLTDGRGVTALGRDVADRLVFGTMSPWAAA